MKKIETSFETLKKDIGDFYKPELHHFITMNAVDLGNEMEYQWFFCDYHYPSDITMFNTKASPTVMVPSIKDIVIPAWVAEVELVDLMGIEIEGAQKGFVLEPDFDTAPLRKKK